MATERTTTYSWYARCILPKQQRQVQSACTYHFRCRKLPSKTTHRQYGYGSQTTDDSATHGSIVDYESHKITTTTQSTTVAELNALMKCFGTCLFLHALWADVSGEIVPIHIRTDANNLGTTAQTTHMRVTLDIEMT